MVSMCEKSSSLWAGGLVEHAAAPTHYSEQLLLSAKQREEAPYPPTPQIQLCTLLTQEQLFSYKYSG